MIFVTQVVKKLCSVVMLLCIIVPNNTAAEGLPAGVVIAQIQTGSQASTSAEYISIFNNSDKPITISGWCLQYATASDATQTTLFCIPSEPAVQLFIPALSAITFSTIELNLKSNYLFNAGLSGTSGHVRLLDNSKQIIDSVGWGSATKPESKAVTAHPVGKLLQRKLDGTVYVDTNNNALDMEAADIVYLPSGHINEEIIILPPVLPLELTELMPNPEGVDTGKEFIEIYNPNEVAVQLADYMLQISPNYSKNYPLLNKIISPHEYVVLSDTESKLVLPNTAAAVRLLSTSSILVGESARYEDPVESSSWAYIDNLWQTTFNPTPGAANISMATKPCDEGFQHNDASDKCIKPPAPIAQVACKINQTRNLETGRCRNIPVTTQTACKVNQVKSQETGRCKNLTVSATVKPCPTGQTRNADTGRCRKELPPINKAGVTDVNTPLVTNHIKWWITGAGMVAAAGYALFEWRKEVLLTLSNLKNKFAISA